MSDDQTAGSAAAGRGGERKRGRACSRTNVQAMAAARALTGRRRIVAHLRIGLGLTTSSSGGGGGADERIGADAECSKQRDAGEGLAAPAAATAAGSSRRSG
ncbi:hypothetical protein Scep_016355 [Stephania cephalantha]|uniref:Uncharacterized protein n=1 Tax=Stephania cephalantha TaxID=152367 RepID=A0AAP0IPE5_9MAGN